MKTYTITSEDFNKYIKVTLKYRPILNKFHKIGILKTLKEVGSRKNFILDINTSKTMKVDNRPDIINVKEGNLIRDPNIFIRIKKTTKNDRWIRLTEEQFNTIKRSADDKNIYMVYSSLRSKTINQNPKTTDLTGMFLKEIENKNKSEIFQKFANLNAECRIEFIISAKDLKKFAYPFERGMNMYETNLFQEKKHSSFYKKSGIRKDVIKIKECPNVNKIVKLQIEKDLYPEKNEISEFKIKGSFKLIYKRKKTYIECVTNVKIQNNIFGTFNLKKDKFYSFNLSTVGRDPKLKRNNLFIAKNRVYELIDSGKIRKPEMVVKEIVKNI